MVVKIDYKDGTFSWQVADDEAALDRGTQNDMGVALKGTATSEVEAMKAGVECIKEITHRRELAKKYPKVIEIVPK